MIDGPDCHTTHDSCGGYVASSRNSIGMGGGYFTHANRYKADESDPTLNHAFGQIQQAGDKWLRVVYRMDKHTHLVVTAFFDRNQEKRK